MSNSEVNDMSDMVFIMPHNDCKDLPLMKTDCRKAKNYTTITE
jgi:hypothetical protein